MSANPSRLSWFLALVPMFVACAPTISVQVLEPAAVTMPAEIRTLAVVDRAAPKNAGETILGTLEAALTGESLMADREGRSAAVTSLNQTLANSPRFKVVMPNISKEKAETGIFDKELSWKAAEKICKQAECDAIVALEAFDSDSNVNMSNVVDAATKAVTYTARRDTRVLAAWRVYDVQNKVVIDDLRDISYTRSWDNSASTEADARSGLIDQTGTLRVLGADAGYQYARRIAPTYVWVSRAYYGSGHDRLKEARNYVKAQDWDGAAKIYRQMVERQDDPKVRGKAEFNLALYYEVMGDLPKAKDMAQKAAVDLHNGRSRNYVALLSQRLIDQQRLAEQMKKPEPKPEPAKAEPPASGSTGQGTRVPKPGSRNK